MLDFRTFKWRPADETPSAEERRGRFMVTLYWPESKDITISRATYYRVGDVNVWGTSDRCTFAELGAEVKFWAPVKQVFIATEAA